MPQQKSLKIYISNPTIYSIYPRGSINKVIVAGIPSRAKARRLGNRPFPGGFIIGGKGPTVFPNW